MGTDKALIDFEGRSLIVRVLEVLRTLSDDILIVSDRRDIDAEPGARIVPDLRPDCGPLGGIGGGLRTMRHDLAVVVACDMPFLNAHFLRALAEKARGLDGAVPLKNGQYEPLHAVYRRTCFPAVEHRLDAGDLRAFSFYSDVRIRAVPEAEWRPIDPEGLSLANLNSAEDLGRVKDSAPKI